MSILHGQIKRNYIHIGINYYTIPVLYFVCNELFKLYIALQLNVYWRW